MNYYSENGVDKFLSDKLPSFGYAVDVGANNGVVGSNTLHFEERGWLVLCLEPNTRLASEGRQRRKLWRDVACGSRSDDAAEFTCVGSYPYSAYSGFNVEVGAKWMPPNTEDRKRTLAVQVKELVRVVTLDDALGESGFPRLDFLSVDTEGHELEVLKGINLDVWRPAWICAESWEDPAPFTAHLKESGYTLAGKFEVDWLYHRNAL